MDRHPSLLRRGARLLWSSVRTHPLPFAVSVTGTVLFSSMSVLVTVALGRLTDRVLVPTFTRTPPERRVIVTAVGLLLGVAVLRSLGVLMRRYFSAMTSRRMQVTWQRRVTDRYLDVPLAFHQTRPSGELLAHADADVEASIEAMNPLPLSLGALLIVVFAVAALLLVDPVMAVVGVLLFPALGVINRLYTRRVEAPATRAQARVGDVSAIAHESFDGSLVVKTLGLEEREVARLAAAAEELRVERIRVGRLRGSFEPALDALPTLGVIGLLAIGSWRISNGALSTGELVQSMALFGILTFPVRVLGYLLEEIPRSVVGADRILRMLRDTEPLLARVTDAAASAPAGGRLPDGPLSLRADHLRFAHGDDLVLDDVSLDVAPGEIVAVVGPTGSGKSTLCNVLAGLLDPTGGRVVLGGVPITDLAADELRAAVAVVFQETFLFADTVRHNLALGTDATDEEVWDAARVAVAAEFVRALPAGLDEVLGERGVTLSGGQRQRLALARALLRRPRLLLLDDATSAIDPLVEQEILARLRATLDTTTVLVAHRLATITLADRVLYLEAGRIAAQGTHDELLAHPGYAALVRAYEQEAA